MQPLVSICIPTYNAERTIEETLVSLVNQTYKNIEIIISDNCSTDRTLSIVEKYKKYIKKIHKFEKNQGWVENFDNCLYLGEGKYKAVYHSDDIYDFDMVEKQVEVLESFNEVGAVFTGARLIDGSSKLIGNLNTKFLSKRLNLFNLEEIFKLVLKHYNFLVCPSAMVRSDIYKDEIKRWRKELFDSSVDLDVWLRIAENHKLAIINEQLMSLRKSKTHLSYFTDSIRTKPAPFFDVINYFIEAKKISLNDKDRNNLNLLHLTDKIKRCINYIKLKDFSNAKKVLPKLSLKNNLLSRRWLKVFIASIALNFYLKFIISAKYFKING